jgi:PqqD family protein of HPr-rel-A system
VTDEQAEVSGAAIPSRAPSAVAVELDGETVLFDERSGTLHLLDAVGTVVWCRLDGSTTLDDLARELATTFATDEHRVRADLVAFLQELDRQHLVEGVAPNARAR